MIMRLIHCRLSCPLASGDSAEDERMRDVGGDDGGEAGEESWVELMVFAEQDGGGDDAVNRLEVVRQVGGVGAEMPQQTDVKGISEKRARPGEQQ